MDISVIIPTVGRPAQLAACVRSLCRQELRDIPGRGGAGARFEVLVGIDGEDEASVQAARDAWDADEAATLHVFPGPKVGLAATRNRVLGHARGRIVVSVNDDVLAQPGFLAAHLSAHLEAERRGVPAVIVGDSPWNLFENDSLFDRLVRETSMIFFYDRMNTPEPVSGLWTDWGFRHCFGLNHSVHASALRAVGGYAVFPATYGYEDVELAWRLRETFGTRVLYRPAARLTHDHRYTPESYLEREYKLGFAAWGFAKTAPACASALFRRDVTSGAELEYSRQFVAREKLAVERSRESFTRLRSIPSSAVDGPHAGEVIGLVYEQHLQLKRWTWRTGLIAAADQAAASRQLHVASVAVGTK